MSKPLRTEEMIPDFRAVLTRLGVKQTRDFIDAQEENFLIDEIKRCPTPDDRAVKQECDRTKVIRFGHDYNDPPKPCESIPNWLIAFCEDAALVPFNSVTVNFYDRGAGIPAHVDHVKRFGPVISILSLGAPAILRLWRPRQSEEENMAWVDVPMEPRSLVQLTKDSRYKWRHSVPCVRNPRWSIVFRHRIDL